MGLAFVSALHAAYSVKRVTILRSSRKEMLLLLIQQGLKDINYKNNRNENLLHLLVQLLEVKDDYDAIESASVILNYGVSAHECDIALNIRYWTWLKL